MVVVVEGGGYEIKMPGSLSNEDEGQDDMDFEDDMPGEVKVGEGGGGVSFTSLLFFFPSLFHPPAPPSLPALLAPLPPP